MATNTFFNNYEESSEQGWIEDMAVEVIQMHGLDCYYLPRTIVNENPIYVEEQLSRFNSHYIIELMIKNFDAFAGDGQFLSKFGGFEIRDRITFVMSIRRFEEEIGQNEGFRMAREGDLIFLPMTGAIYEIKMVEQEQPFYQLGKLYTYDLVCELFEYNSEEFATGIPQVDRIQPGYSQDTETQLLVDEAGNVIVDDNGDAIFIGAEDFVEEQDILAQNEKFQNEISGVVDISEYNPFKKRTT